MRFATYARSVRLPNAIATNRTPSEFWDRMAALVSEFDELPRSGDTVYGFAVGIYPTDHPRLPDTAD